MKGFFRAAFALLIVAGAAPTLAAEPVTPLKPATLSQANSAIATPAPHLPPVLGPVQNGTPTATVPLTAQTPAITPPTPTAAVPLHDLVIAYVDRGTVDADQDCLATAVYFEARSEPLEGQLAVAKVILNRAGSGTFPTSICEVVKQPAQFSFVRRGRMPPPDKTSDCWHRALAIADIARSRTLAGEIAANVLWYHATYVSPSWDRQRTRIAQIGRHIFFS